MEVAEVALAPTLPCAMGTVDGKINEAKNLPGPLKRTAKGTVKIGRKDLK